MLEELLSRRLKVAKWRTETGWVRGPIETNPEWYQAFCGEYTRRRKRYPKTRTFIKRCNTVNALKQIAEDRVNPTNQYVERLRPFVEEYSSLNLGEPEP